VCARARARTRIVYVFVCLCVCVCVCVCALGKLVARVFVWEDGRVCDAFHCGK
jgi:hypothetical protein